MAHTSNFCVFIMVVYYLFAVFSVKTDYDRVANCLVFLFPCRNELSNSYTMGCPPVRGDNPRALASGLSYVQVDKHGITSLYHLHQCRPCPSRDILC